MSPQLSTLKEFASVRLYVFDGLYRAGVDLLVIALGATLLYALLHTYSAGMWLWLLGAILAYGIPKDRGFRSARIIKHNGYRFKAWRGYDGNFCWQSVDWPFLEQHANQDEYQARQTIDGYISTGVLPTVDQPPTAHEVRRENAYQAFRGWIKEYELDWSPRIQELLTELRYWRDGDARLYTEAKNYYETKRRAREELDSDW